MTLRLVKDTPKRYVPNLQVLPPIAEATGVDLADLYEELRKYLNAWGDEVRLREIFHLSWKAYQDCSWQTFCDVVCWLYLGSDFPEDVSTPA